jgi:hypothetical protein
MGLAYLGLFYWTTALDAWNEENRVEFDQLNLLKNQTSWFDYSEDPKADYTGAYCIQDI